MNLRADESDGQTKQTKQAKKNAAEAALKIWRHPSMKESLLALGSIAEIWLFIHYEICN